MDFLASHGFDFNKFVYEVSTRANALCDKSLIPSP